MFASRSRNQCVELRAKAVKTLWMEVKKKTLKIPNTSHSSFYNEPADKSWFSKSVDRSFGVVGYFKHLWYEIEIFSSYPLLPSLIRITNLASGDVRPASMWITAWYLPLVIRSSGGWLKFNSEAFIFRLSSWLSYDVTYLKYGVLLLNVKSRTSIEPE